MKPLHVRLAAWGTVLVIAAVAFNVRSGAGDADQGANGPQLNGTTTQGLPMWAVAGDGRVREIRMVWEFRCDRGARVKPLGVNVRDSVDGFERRGSGFAFEDRAMRDGAEVRVRLAGTARHGESSAELRLGDGATCRSGPVSWSAG